MTSNPSGRSAPNSFVNESRGSTRYYGPPGGPSAFVANMTPMSIVEQVEYGSEEPKKSDDPANSLHSSGEATPPKRVPRQLDPSAPAFSLCSTFDLYKALQVVDPGLVEETPKEDNLV